MQIAFGWVSIDLFPAAPYSMCAAAPAWVTGLAFARQRGVHAIGDEQRCDFDAWPGDIALTAPAVNIFSESMAGGEYLALHVEDSTAMPDAPMAAPRTVVHGNRRAVALGLGLRRLLLAPQPDIAHIEQQAALFLACAWSPLASPRRAGGRYRPDRRVHARVLAYIDATLDGPMRLDDLARLAGMPLLRFLRSFTAATGMTPHAYITERRVQRARVMLATTDEPVAGIAASCGFAHQSHLGAVLKQQTGWRPLDYRRLFRTTR